MLRFFNCIKWKKIPFEIISRQHQDIVQDVIDRLILEIKGIHISAGDGNKEARVQALSESNQLLIIDDTISSLDRLRYSDNEYLKYSYYIQVSKGKLSHAFLYQSLIDSGRYFNFLKPPNKPVLLKPLKRILVR